MVTDEKGPLQPYIDLSQLRFRERDDLEFVFKFWRNIGNKKKFDAKLLWEERCRSYYGARYDAREGVADWDLNMKLAEKASIIYKREFFKWRTHGIAYEVRESAYDYANRTMASVDGLKENGVMVVKWGIFSDIVSGPFYAYGIESENKELLKKSNEKHTQVKMESGGEIKKEENQRKIFTEYFFFALHRLAKMLPNIICGPCCTSFIINQSMSRKSMPLMLEYKSRSKRVKVRGKRSRRLRKSQMKMKRLQQ